MEDYIDICNELQGLRKSIELLTVTYSSYTAMMLNLKQVELGMKSPKTAMQEIEKIADGHTTYVEGTEKSQ